VFRILPADVLPGKPSDPRITFCSSPQASQLFAILRGGGRGGGGAPGGNPSRTRSSTDRPGPVPGHAHRAFPERRRQTNGTPGTAEHLRVRGPRGTTSSSGVGRARRQLASPRDMAVSQSSEHTGRWSSPCTKGILLLAGRDAALPRAGPNEDWPQGRAARCDGLGGSQARRQQVRACSPAPGPRKAGRNADSAGRLFIIGNLQPEVGARERSCSTRKIDLDPVLTTAVLTRKPSGTWRLGVRFPRPAH
jgi:hypothetical protein